MIMRRKSIFLMVDLHGTNASGVAKLTKICRWIDEKYLYAQKKLLCVGIPLYGVGISEMSSHRRTYLFSGSPVFIPGTDRN